MRRAIPCFAFAAVLVVGALPHANATQVEIAGPVNHFIRDHTVTLHATRLLNRTETAPSGPLRLELRARGYLPGASAPTELRTAAFGVAPIAAGAQVDDVDSGPLPFAYPPAGSWLLTIVLSEQVAGAPGDGYVDRTTASAWPAILDLGPGESGPARLVGPATIDFGIQVVGTSQTQTVWVTNEGRAGAWLPDENRSSTLPGEFVPPFGPVTLPPGSGQSLTVTFTPQAVGPRAATITIDGQPLVAPYNLQVTGIGSAAPQGRLSMTGGYGFSAVMVGAAFGPNRVPLHNDAGSLPVRISSISVDNPAEFPLAGTQNCTVVEPGAECAFEFTFAPKDVGTRRATITIESDGVGSPQTIGLDGGGVLPPPPTAMVSNVVEYHHAQFDHYFITASEDEIAKLDGGVFAGWARTGLTFGVWNLATPSTRDVCRFFSTAFGPKSSHFYSSNLGECTYVRKNPDWQYEADVFGAAIIVLAPELCMPGSTPPYRLYNDGQGGAPNHRYTTRLDVRAAMIAHGWIPEGYSTLGILGCVVPPAD